MYSRKAKSATKILCAKATICRIVDVEPIPKQGRNAGQLWLGGGRQYMPWVSIDEVVSVIMFALENDRELKEYGAFYGKIGSKH